MPRPAWSPDSRWIVYALVNRTWYHTVYAYDLETRRSRPITDGLSDAADPVFDAGGKYLYFFASTDAGPVNQWFSQAAEDMRSAAFDLPGGAPQGHRFAAGAARATRKSRPTRPTSKPKEPKDDKPKDAKPDKPAPVAIDFDGSNSGSWPCPSRRRTTPNLQAGQAGQVFYLDWT